MRNELKELIDETFQNGFININYKDYIFYFHILAQCKVIYDNSILPAPAGVSFRDLKYYLHISDDFDSLSLENRLAVFKHEALHIIYLHIGRSLGKKETTFNYSADCAINQQINKNHLLEHSITPETLSEFYKIDIPLLKDTETYYDLLDNIVDEENESCNNSCNSTSMSESESDESGSCDNDSDKDGDNPEKSSSGSGEDSDKPGTENHKTWKESDKDDASQELMERRTEKMVNNAIERSKGDIPSNISDILKIYKRKSVVNWRKLVKKAMSNKRANKLSTIKRRSRRIDQLGFKGNKKDYLYNVVCLLDVSGSMSNDDILYGISELRHLCKKTNSDLRIIQIDSKIKEVEDFDVNSKTFDRLGCGGTKMKPGYDYIHEHKMNPDLTILITDGWIDSPEYWKLPKCKNVILTVDKMIDYGKLMCFHLK
jgi:predicted metal-dependent peptidase